jgi:PAS domain S-box-containing protein
MAENQVDSTQKNKALEAQIQELQARLDEARETLRAISTGEVDALVVYGEHSERIYTLQGADHAYRTMVESIHEGAATIKADGMILYCNKRLAEMLETPLETLLGSSFHNYIYPHEQETFHELVRKGLESNGRAEFNVICYRGATIPVLISASAAEIEGRRAICLVITDLTEQKQSLSRERQLQVRLMEQREEERVRIARNLHDGPLQELISISYTIQAIVQTDPGQGQISSGDLRPVLENIKKLSGDLRAVCNELRPPQTVRFGLAKAIQYHVEEFSVKYPDLKIHLDLASDGLSLPREITGALFRIYQECLNNIIRHANATEVTIRFSLDNNRIRLEIEDNGQGFQIRSDWGEFAREGHLGLMGMRERAEEVGGKIVINTNNGGGTKVRVEVPVYRQPELAARDRIIRLFVGAMQPGQGRVYEQPNRYRQRRPVRRAVWFYGRATLPASFCFRSPRSSAGCIAPTKNRPCFAVAY